MSGIFITYRREDTQGFAGRLDDDLSERFGEALIFRDREIEPGEDFAKRLRATLDAADVALAVIGARWEDACDSQGRRRLDQSDDWVRIELETVLARGIPVVPVLVGGARMPASAALPDTLQDFSRRQAFPLSDLRWHSEVKELAARLATMSPTLDEAFRAHGGAQESTSGTPALRQLADRVVEEATQRSRETHGTGGPPLWSLRVLRWLGVRTRRLVTTAIGVGFVYLLMREFGGPDLNRYFDRFAARVVDTARALIAPLMEP